MHIWAQLYLGLCCKFQSWHSNSNIKPLLSPLQMYIYTQQQLQQVPVQTLLVSRGKMPIVHFMNSECQGISIYLVSIPPHMNSI